MQEWQQPQLSDAPDAQSSDVSGATLSDTPDALRRGLMEVVGVGGMALLICIIGISVGSKANAYYPLVLRDEQLWLGQPTRWTIAALFLTCTVLLGVPLLAWSLHWHLSPGLLFGSNMTNPYSRAGSWLAIGVVAGLGISMGTLGLIQFINGACDHSPAQRHETTVNNKYSPSRLMPYFILTDWKAPNRSLDLTVDYNTYARHPIGARIPITTKSGFLGYEWISKFP